MCLVFKACEIHQGPVTSPCVSTFSFLIPPPLVIFCYTAVLMLVTFFTYNARVNEAFSIEF